uniref:Uncharacterized protein n=1 Tax=Oryza sativa subsp. japonica TaxID=39947 RepID=Q8LH84_ORYSJ|nr:hypothetical protein [Oryza sativa Japonica Group]BAC16099.1 hypothetical protein [Oryza sativa Japonica Group]
MARLGFVPVPSRPDYRAVPGLPHRHARPAWHERADMAKLQRRRRGNRLISNKAQCATSSFGPAWPDPTAGGPCLGLRHGTWASTGRHEEPTVPY